MKYLLFFLLTPSLYSQKAEWLTYNQNIFDSDTCCWRKWSAEMEYEKSAQLIEDFIQHGNVENRQSLNWHAGQMFAFAGNTPKALSSFRKTYSPFQKWFGGNDGKTWFFFAKGTSAFIKRDRPVLERIVSKWKKKWLPDNNFIELVRLYEHWDLPYKEATSANLK